MFVQVYANPFIDKRIMNIMKWEFRCNVHSVCANSLCSEQPFEGAEGNLQRLFEKNHKRYQELTAEPGRTGLEPEEQW